MLERLTVITVENCFDNGCFYRQIISTWNDLLPVSFLIHSLLPFFSFHRFELPQWCFEFPMLHEKKLMCIEARRKMKPFSFYAFALFHFHFFSKFDNYAFLPFSDSQSLFVFLTIFAIHIIEFILFHGAFFRRLMTLISHHLCNFLCFFSDTNSSSSSWHSYHPCNSCFIALCLLFPFFFQLFLLRSDSDFMPFVQFFWRCFLMARENR